MPRKELSEEAKERKREYNRERNKRLNYATAKEYRKNSFKVNLTLQPQKYPRIIKKLQSVENKTRYICGLIEKDLRENE